MRKGAAALFLMIWRSLLIALTQCGAEGTVVSTDSVLQFVALRWRSKMEALKIEAIRKKSITIARGRQWEESPFKKALSPICEFTPDLRIVYFDDYKWLEPE